MNCKKWLALMMATLLLTGLLCGCQENPTGDPSTQQEEQADDSTHVTTDNTTTDSSSDVTGGSSAQQTTGQTTSPSAGVAPETVPTVSGVDTEDQFSNRDEKTEYDASKAMPIALKDGASAGKGVLIKGNTITISKEGTYVISGSLSNGRLIVDTDKETKVHLVFNGVSITCQGYGALYVKKADKVFITLNEGTDNRLATTVASTSGVEENVDGALFSKDDLTINGSGRLSVNSTGHGIVCKADLVFTGGNVTVDAAGHALQAKKSARIGDGTFNLTAAKDGIHVENPDDTTEGYLYIEDGNFTVKAEGDGFSAATLLQVSGGKGTLTCGGGAAAAPPHSGGGYPGWGYTSSNTDDDSNKGMKGGTSVLVAGGTWTLDTADDGVHSNGDLTLAGGTLTIATGDDGLHADNLTVVKGGVLNITKSYEGIEGNAVEIMGGTITLVASDDGINAAGGNDQSGFDGGRPDQFAGGDNSCYIRISGGKMTINAAGDGIDANNCLYVEGGETYVSGPTNSGNGALDYDRNAEVTGGILVAAGSQGMAQGFSSATNQCGVLVTVGSTTGEILLKDSKGNVLIRWTPEKTYATVAFTCPGLVKGETYTLVTGGTEQQIEMTDWIVGSSGGFGGGPGGMPPGVGGRPGRW